MGNDKKYTENYDEVTAEGFNYDSWNGGSGVGSKSNIEKLAEDYVNSSYDKFTQGTDYASLAKRYSTQGRRAMDDTLGMAAARTGGLASSYAVAAGNQAYNDHMSKLEDAARALYDSQMTEKANKLTVAQGLYDRQYGEWENERDFGFDVYQDSVSNAQWKDEQITSQSNKDREWDYTVATDEQAEARDQALIRFSEGIFPTSEEEIAALMEATGWDAATIAAYQACYEDINTDEAAAEATETSLEADSVLMDLLGSGMTWEEINSNPKYAQYVESSTFGEDYWTNIAEGIAEENAVNDYTYARTEEGAENIINALINSASMTLNNKDAENFDYIFGDGAYDAIQGFVGGLPRGLNDTVLMWQRTKNNGVFEQYLNKWMDDVSAAVPGLTKNQLLAIVEAKVPDLLDLVDGTADPSSFAGKAFGNGEWTALMG